MAMLQAGEAHLTGLPAWLTYVHAVLSGVRAAGKVASTLPTHIRMTQVAWVCVLYADFTGAIHTEIDPWPATSPSLSASSATI
jgi:hypothetical protein